MLKQSTNSPSRRSHLDAGALAPMVEQFTNDLMVLGYRRLTVSAFSDSSRHFADWICRSVIAPCDVNIGTIEQFAQHQCLCPGGRRLHLVSKNYVSRVRRFISFLADNGVIPAPAPPAAGQPMQPRAVEIMEWLRHHRGLSERTIELRGHVLRRLLLTLATRCGFSARSDPPVRC
jgi:integrase/recombinase XerD